MHFCHVLHLPHQDPLLYLSSCPPCMQEHTSVSRKHRTPFTLDEEDYVIQGVAKFGKRWRHVLSSFPFNSSRTVVDIKDKYRNLKARSICPSSWQ